MMNMDQYDKTFHVIMENLTKLEFDEALRVMGGIMNMMMHSIPEADRRAEQMANWISTLMDIELDMQRNEEVRRHELH